MKTLLTSMIAVSLVTGCATLVHGTKQQVSIELLQGGGRAVIYDDALYGIKSEIETELPNVVSLHRKKFYKIDVFHQDYGKRTIKIRPDYNYGDVISNLFTFTMVVDTFTGSSRSFDSKIVINMEGSTENPN